jgi:hypothetical protein
MRRKGEKLGKSCVWESLANRALTGGVAQTYPSLVSPTHLVL